MNFLGPRLHWVSVALVAIVFAGGGVGKLMSMPQFHAAFMDLNWPSWSGYAVGAAEVLGVLALFVPSLRKLAAFGLGAISCGAIWYHVSFPPVSAAAPAFVMLICCLLILMYRPAGVHR